VTNRVKIDVYLTKEQKKVIERKAKKLDVSLSDYLKLKALGVLEDE
jgi:hypothetical protein